MDDDLPGARRVLHAVAEHLLAGPQWRQTGEIALTVSPGGFSTTHAPAPDLTAIQVRGREVVTEPGGRTVPIGGSIAAMAAALGLEPGPPEGLYGDHAEIGPAGLLPADGITGGIETILAAFADGDAALSRLDPRQRPILWPEHFDVGISSGEINYGVSPGDAGHDQPYAYVGPWSSPPPDDFWNEPFGASQPMAALGGVPGVLEFFRTGQRLAGGT